MGLLSRIRDAFRAPPKLRNRVGGLAFIKPYGQAHGADVLAGHVVKTVAVLEGGRIWLIDPPQRYIVTGRAVRTSLNGTAFLGDRVTVLGLADELLDPIPEVGDDEQDESKAWLPDVPTHTPSKEPNHA